MKLVTHPIFLEHQTGSHPENPRRLEVIQGSENVFVEMDEGLDLVHLVHRKNYVEEVRDACKQAPAWLDGDTMVSAHSYEAALSAVALSVEAARSGDFALVRPPGHHAYPDHASGFCLFNNIAVAVESLVQKDKRVLILDFDGHLGDGTLFYFYQTDKVLFWSLHQYPAFPGMGKSSEIGHGQGKGFSINVPLPPGSGDDIFQHALRHYWVILDQFEPDIIAVSAGFDAHRFDPLLQLNLTESSYFEIGKMLRETGIPTFALLEGGYNLDILPRCVEHFLAGIQGEVIPKPPTSMTSNRQTWERYDLELHIATSLLRPFWKF